MLKEFLKSLFISEHFEGFLYMSAEKLKLRNHWWPSAAANFIYFLSY